MDTVKLRRYGIARNRKVKRRNHEPKYILSATLYIYYFRRPPKVHAAGPGPRAAKAKRPPRRLRAHAEQWWFQKQVDHAIRSHQRAGAAGCALHPACRSAAPCWPRQEVRCQCGPLRGRLAPGARVGLTHMHRLLYPTACPAPCRGHAPAPARRAARLHARLHARLRRGRGRRQRAAARGGVAVGLGG